MLRALVRASLEYRVVVLLLAAGLIVAGAFAVRDTPWDVFPEFAPPQIVIQCEGPGLSTEQIERMVTKPIEDVLNGMSHLETLRSQSVPGLSVVTATFDEQIPILVARQLANERLTEVTPVLPSGVQPPRMTPMAASTSRLEMIGLTSKRVSLMDLRTWTDRVLRTRLRSVKGVAGVEVFGGEVKQYDIYVTPDRLQQYGVTLDQVTTAARSATAFGGAGFLETANQRLPINQRTRIESVADLAAVPVAVQAGVSVTLGHVADVTIGAASQFGDATIDGARGILLVLHKQPFTNTLTVSQGVQDALDDVAESMPRGIELHRTLFSQATFIERAISNLTWAVALGCVLVTLVLVAFLFQWRTVVISLTAIPLSLLGAILVLRGFGISLNAMTLGGLAIALGEVVDDAIVDVENVLRRLLENRRLPQPRSAFQVVLRASLEVRSAVVYASFIVILVFLPVFFLGGLAGNFFRPLGFAYIAAILVSLAVALTVTPAMCLMLLGHLRPGAAREPLVARALKRGYRRMLPWCLESRGFVLVSGGALLAAAIGVVPFLGGEFLPDFRESNFVIQVSASPDGSLTESIRLGRLIADRLLKVPEVKSVAQQIGRADLSEDTWGPNNSELWVVIRDGADYDQALAQLREACDGVPGCVFEIKQFLKERIDEVLSGTTANIVVQLVGDDLEVLRTEAGKAAKLAAEVRGVKDLRVEQQVNVPQIEVLLRPREASSYGFAVGDLNQAVQTYLRGTEVGQVYEGNLAVNVVVQAHPSVRANPLALGELLVDSPAGEKLPLRAVASISLAQAPNIINHDAARRRIQITCNAENRDVASVAREIQQRLKSDAKLPTGYHFEFTGQLAAQQEAFTRMLLLGAATLVGIFVLLYLDFKSVGLTLLVMMSVPLACVGGVAAVLLTGGSVSMGSMVGFVTLFGIAMRNGILLVSHYRHLEHAEGMPIGQELIERGATERLIPILMTAGSAALGLLPLVVLGRLPGNEIEHPMAAVILGGLVSSTFLTLFVLPVLYEWYRRREATRQRFESPGVNPLPSSL